jgi:acetyl esterase/lipase
MGRRLRLGLGVAAAAGIAAVAVLGAARDGSPLGRAPAELAVVRNAAYGPDLHHRLDLVHARDVGRLRPALVMIHPGGWMQGDRSAYHGWMLPYARLGYATVSLDFRPSGVAPYPAAVRDVKRAVRWLRANATSYGIDPGRIGVTGWSSGAHLAALVALSDDAFEADGAHPGVSARVQAVVAVSGVYDFLMRERGAFPNAGDVAAVVRFLGGPPDADPEKARRASPLHHLTADDPPLLAIHGELDRRIDVEQARQLARALRALGRADEVILLPGLDHGRDVFPGDLPTRGRIQAFLARHLHE